MYEQVKNLGNKQIKTIHISSNGENMVIDVVCGMEIDEKEAKWKSEYEGKTFYFCGPLCKMEFDENPEKYTKSNQTIALN